MSQMRYRKYQLCLRKYGVNFLRKCYTYVQKNVVQVLDVSYNGYRFGLSITSFGKSVYVEKKTFN